VIVLLNVTSSSANCEKKSQSRFAIVIVVFFRTRFSWKRTKEICIHIVSTQRSGPQRGFLLVVRVVGLAYVTVVYLFSGSFDFYLQLNSMQWNLCRRWSKLVDVIV